MWKKALAVILIIAGLSVISYPTVHDWYIKYQQNQLMKQWQETLSPLNEEIINDETINNDIQAVQESAAPAIDLTREMEGLLIIEKIGLKVPILTGVTDRNLNLAVASIAGTGKMGEAGNYCVAGHRSRTRGILFNRLDELANGDKIVIETKEKTCVYIVSESMIVQPDNVQMLKNEGQKKQITLVTCDYRMKPYMRLIIKGELLEIRKKV